MVKPSIKKIQSAEGVLIIDDSIEEKPYTDENDIICRHYDHCKDRNVKALTLFQHFIKTRLRLCRLAARLIAKTEAYFDKKTAKMKRRSPVTKNEMAREMIAQAIKNQIVFRFILFDVWFSGSENLKFIKDDCQKNVICPIKANRKAAIVWKTN